MVKIMTWCQTDEGEKSLYEAMMYQLPNFYVRHSLSMKVMSSVIILYQL